jgi:hypothetical protein
MATLLKMFSEVVGHPLIKMFGARALKHVLQDVREGEATL